MIGFTINVSQDTATPALQRFQAAMVPARLNPIIGRSATNTVREHLFGLNLSRPNQLGGRRTNYYATAARSTHFDVFGDDVIISINQIGMGLHYYGGTVRPRTAKFLTIPVAPEAHGKRAREFNNLELVFGAGGQPIALATQGTRGVQITQNKKGQLVKKNVGRHGVIMFRLVKKVTVKADPGVLPYTELITKRVKDDVNSYIGRIWERSQPQEGDNA